MPSPGTVTNNSGPNGTAYILNHRAKSLANYPHARLLDNGTIYVSGISSRKADNTWEGVEDLPDGTWKLDIREQTKAVIENIKAILNEVGADLKNLVNITVYLVDMKDYGAFNEVYNQYFDALTGPTRTTVAVKELPNPRLLIEIQAQGFLPPSA